MQKFRIGQLASLFGVSVQTLRYYDQIGFFCPAGRDAGNGYRYYSAEQVFELMDLLTFREMGLRLDDIRRNQSQADLGASQALLEEKLDDLERQMVSLRRLKKRLETKIGRLEKARALAGEGEIELVACPQRLARSFFRMRMEKEGGRDELAARKTREFVPEKVLEGELVFSCSLEQVLDPGGMTPSHEVLVYLLLDPESSIRPDRVFPAGIYATTVHRGTFESPGEIRAYRRLADFLGSQGLPAKGPTLEFNLVGGELTRATEDFLTEIQVFVPGA